MSFQAHLNTLTEQGIIPKAYEGLLFNFYLGYPDVLEREQIFLTLLSLVKQECQTPFTFEPFHKSVRTPFDYHTFGLDFAKHLIDKESSSIEGEESLISIQEQLARGENAILLANHQTEIDPIIISTLLEEHYKKLSEEIISVAGQKVITDLLAIPFSMGCNLLCIYSKRYIDHDPESKMHKQLHNQRTMRLMSSLLKEGGKCIYVAPSGGRDRRNAQGIVEVAPFDPDSIEMSRLMAMQAKTLTHFYPLTLSTYDILPPPSTIEKEIGEKRSAKRSPVHICFGKEYDVHLAHLDSSISKHERRKFLAQEIWNQVNSDYQRISL